MVLHITPAAPAGLSSWSLRDRSNADPNAPIDGLASGPSSADLPDTVEHPIGAVGIDHLVVLTPDLDRTIDALAAEGVELRRLREGPAGDGHPVRQAFFRLAEVILEVVATDEPADGPARFWGLTLLVRDLDTAAERLGPDRISPPKPAVQPGRRIATVRTGAGLGIPVALMD